MATKQRKPISSASEGSSDMNGLFAHLSPQDLSLGQLFTSPDQWNDDSDARAYAHYMRRAWEDKDLGVRAIFCVENRPTIYFKEVNRYDAAAESRAQQALWNQGMATMLVVCDPNQVRVYSAFVQPQKSVNEAAQIEEELSQRRIGASLERAAFALELIQWLRRIETGQFYRDHETKFEADQAVDRGLLRNLSAASDKLCDGENGLSRETAHALLGRILFVRYLCDREIIDGKYLGKTIENSNAPHPREWLENLSPTLEARDQLYQFFAAIQSDFNGSFLSKNLEEERQGIGEHHLEVLGHLLRGTELVTGQLSLFPFYNFKLIPIETISAIYESFISLEDQQKVPEDETEAKPKKKQSESGAYYTPRHLAEMTVDAATRGWDTLLDKKCLDPACGSGIFLVVLFNRMAEEWSARNPDADNARRAMELRQLMLGNLCGVDVHQTACRITCFSLYLAFFDQLNPPDILELKNSLHNKGEKVLPLLLGTEEEGFGTSEKGLRPVIFSANFFESPANLFGPGELGRFDLVIGNPPWKGRKQAVDVTMKDWLLGDLNPYSSRPLSRAQKTPIFFPQKQSAIAFMWKVPTHLTEQGRACLVLPSRVFLSDTNKFQEQWLRKVTVERVIQLADYRFFLFENSICPTTLVCFRAMEPQNGTQIIAYDTPKVERIDPRHAVIPILPDDQKFLTVGDVISAAMKKQAPSIWKSKFWGTGRDQILLGRLLKLPPLSNSVGDPKSKKRWKKGDGFQPQDSSPVEKPKLRWWTDEHLFINARSRNIDLFITEQDCHKIGANPQYLRRSPDSSLFQAPLVLINRGFNKFAYSDFPVLFRHALKSIAGLPNDRDLLLFLTGFLNSPLPKYFLFHTTGSWGIERDEVDLNELLTLPFPLPEDTKDPVKSREIVRQVARLVLTAKAEFIGSPGEFLKGSDARKNLIRAAKAEISELVFEYYGVTSKERALIEDTDQIFVPSSTPHSLYSTNISQEHSNSSQREEYTKMLCETLNAWARNQPLRLGGQVFTAPKLGLGLLILQKSSVPLSYNDQPADDQVQGSIERIQRTLSSQQGRFSYLRGFTLFEEDKAYILKPLALRHWTRTAALNDADALATAMLT